MKITDQISLRATALRLAVESDCVGMTPNNVIDRAKAFEMYIQGEVELPDFMPLPGYDLDMNVCNACGREYDDEDDDNQIRLY